MKQKRKIFIISLLLLCVVFLLALFYSKDNQNQSLNIPTRIESINESKAQENLTEQKRLESKPTLESPVSKAEEKKINEINVSLSVLGKEYKTQIEDGLTVFDAMNAIVNKKENNFSFKTKDYSDFGNFVEEINNVPGTPGKYWLYYINNKKASLGISKYVLKEGDIISWKQEAF